MATYTTPTIYHKKKHKQRLSVAPNGSSQLLSKRAKILGYFLWWRTQTEVRVTNFFFFFFTNPLPFLKYGSERLFLQNILPFFFPGFLFFFFARFKLFVFLKVGFRRAPRSLSIVFNYCTTAHIVYSFSEIIYFDRLDDHTKACCGRCVFEIK